MKSGITIIGGGNVGGYLKQTLAASYRVEQISARNLEKNATSVVGMVKGRLHTIFDDRETIQGNIRRLKQGERIIYGGRAGKLLDQLVESIHRECPEQAGNFYIFGINGFQDYGEDIPRLVLNHAIKEEQLTGDKAPVPFSLSGKSYFYHPHPTDFDREFVENAGFDIELTSDKDVFLKALYLKCCVNAVYNSIGIAEGYRYKSSAKIGNSIKYFEEYHGTGFLEKCTDELDRVLRSLAPGLIQKEEIQREIMYVPEMIPNAVASSVGQFYDYGRDEKPRFADYEASDTHLLLGWVLRYAQEHHISTPTLYVIHREIVSNGSRFNGVHINPDLGYFGYSPMPEGYSPIVFDTGVRKQ